MKQNHKIRRPANLLLLIGVSAKQLVTYVVDRSIIDDFTKYCNHLIYNIYLHAVMNH